MDPLLQVLAASQIVVVGVDELNWQLGEVLIALTLLQKEKGYLITGENVDTAKLEKVVKGSIAEQYSINGNVQEELLDFAKKLNKTTDEDCGVVRIDHFFNVKGAGVVALGTVIKGIVKMNDEMEVYPLTKKVKVKSIQIHDLNVNSATLYDRVGLVLKGIEASELKRGYLLSRNFKYRIDNVITKKFEKIPFWKEEIIAGDELRAISGMQCFQVTISEIEKGMITLKTKNKVVVEDPILLYKNDAKNLRLIGKCI